VYYFDSEDGTKNFHRLKRDMEVRVNDQDNLLNRRMTSSALGKSRGKPRTYGGVYASAMTLDVKGLSRASRAKQAKSLYGVMSARASAGYGYRIVSLELEKS
jgi:hypothetical protein